MVEVVVVEELAKKNEPMITELVEELPLPTGLATMKQR